jgi:hypothetical protein
VPSGPKDNVRVPSGPKDNVRVPASLDPEADHVSVCASVLAVRSTSAGGG